MFITNVVKCRPPDNRDPQPDEIAACAPYLRRQLEVLDPAVVVTLGRYSMGTFMPGCPDRAGARHGRTRSTRRPVRRDALVFAMYHPAAALRTPGVERESFEDIARVPAVAARRPRDARGRRATRPRPPHPTAPATRHRTPPRRIRAAATTRVETRRPADPTAAHPPSPPPIPRPTRPPS